MGKVLMDCPKVKWTWLQAWLIAAPSQIPNQQVMIGEIAIEGSLKLPVVLHAVGKCVAHDDDMGIFFGVKPDLCMVACVQKKQNCAEEKKDSHGDDSIIRVRVKQTSSPIAMKISNVFLTVQIGINSSLMNISHESLRSQASDRVCERSLNRLETNGAKGNKQHTCGSVKKDIGS
ncbi:MAG TPA: hypothetical protein VK628_08085 [Flavitalea sp.]|nr:hypothetical protein [Flavitalea sp.]